MSSVSCRKCNAEWNGREDKVSCSGTCRGSFHLKCANISTSVFNTLMKTPHLQYYCSECLDLNIGSVVQRLDDLTSMLTKFCDIFALFSEMMKSSLTANNITACTNNHVEVQRSNSPVNNVIRGQDLSTDSLKSVQVADKHFLCVSRLHPSTTSEQIITHISSRIGVDVSSDLICNSLIPKNRKIEDLSYISFKIGVNTNVLDKVTDPSIWPVGIVIRDFIYRPRVLPNVMLSHPKKLLEDPPSIQHSTIFQSSGLPASPTKSPSVSAKKIKSKLFIIHQNIRSLRKNFNLFLANVAALEMLPQIILLSEVWINHYELENYQIPGFQIYGNCNSSNRAGGVVVYVNEVVKCNAISCIRTVSADIIQVNIKFNCDLFSILCVYKLHASNTAIFVDEFSNVLAANKSKNLLVFGDMNINILNKTSSSDYVLMMSSYGLKSLINKPTPISNGSSTCLDHLYFRHSVKFLFDYEAAIHDLHITDHCMTSIIIVPNSNYNDLNSTRSTKLKINKINFSKLVYDLGNETWLSVYSKADVTDAYNCFIDLLKLYIDNNTFLVEIKSKDNILKPWVNQDLCRKIRIKNKFSRKLAKQPYNTDLKQKVCMLSKSIKKEVNMAKTKFYDIRFNNVKGDIKKSWKVLNELLGKGIKRVAVEEIVVDEHHVVTQDVEKAELFNKFFVSVVQDLKINDLNEDIYCDDLLANNSQLKSFAFYDTFPLEILQVISSLKSTNSSGNDKISNFVVKKIAVYIVDVFSYIVNASFSTGVFPSRLKEAVIIPIFKNGDKKALSNYRPISLLSVFAKIIEKLAHVRISGFLNHTNFLHKMQFGFRKSRSTENALLKVTNFLYKGLDVRNSVASVFVDLKKAFDMVNHRVLLKKLFCAGFRGDSFQWFNSYLSNRVQSVKLNDCVSQSLVINDGVPQGSVLGPLLFLIYLNSLFYIEFKSVVVAFADDLVFMYNEPTRIDTINRIHFDLALLRKWCDVHSMLLSTKTKAMFYSLNGASISDQNIIYHESECNQATCSNACLKIECVPTFKYLGLTIDNSLNWKCQTGHLLNYLVSVIRKMYILRLVCPIAVLKNVYFALVNSKLSYGIVCWGGTYYVTIQPLVTAQKHILRIMKGKPKLTESWPLFQCLEIFPLRHLFVFKVLKEFYLIANNDTSVNSSNYILRNKQHVHLQKFTTTSFQNSFLILAPKIYNSLPNDLKTCTKFKIFTSLLKSHLLNCSNINDLWHFQV